MDARVDPLAVPLSPTGLSLPGLDRLRAGDPAAVAQIVREFSPRMLAIARKLLGSEHDAQDALQDAWISALRALPTFQGDAMLSTWLHRIVVNASLMKLRSARRGVRGREQPIDDLLPSFRWFGHFKGHPRDWTEGSDALEADERRRLVRACIEALPESFRTVILLRDIEEMDTESTAKLLGLTPGATKAKLHRARQALRTLLERAMDRGSDASAREGGRK